MSIDGFGCRGFWVSGLGYIGLWVWSLGLGFVGFGASGLGLRVVYEITIITVIKAMTVKASRGDELGIVMV